jgi:hypothetical protein
MARAGRRYPLILYTHILNRWWPATLTLGLAVFGLAWAVSGRYPGQSWQWMTLAAAGGFVLIGSIFLFAIRKAAYIQPFGDHLRLSTPFLRLNISYKRLRRTATATINSLFPPSSVKGWGREIIGPLGNRTAIVVELNGYPISQATLRFFLSPFFFKDRTPHFVFVIDDWMRFTTELESLRVGGEISQPRQPVDRSILSRLPRK